MVLIFPPEPSKECVKVSHVIFECRVINRHPTKIAFNSLKPIISNASKRFDCCIKYTLLWILL